MVQEEQRAGTYKASAACCGALEARVVSQGDSPCSWCRRTSCIKQHIQVKKATTQVRGIRNTCETIRHLGLAAYASSAYICQNHMVSFSLSMHSSIMCLHHFCQGVSSVCPAQQHTSAGTAVQQYIQHSCVTPALHMTIEYGMQM